MEVQKMIKARKLEEAQQSLRLETEPNNLTQQILTHSTLSPSTMKKRGNEAVSIVTHSVPPSREDNRTPIHGALSNKAKMNLLEIGSSTTSLDAKPQPSSIRRFIDHRISEKHNLFK